MSAIYKSEKNEASKCSERVHLSKGKQLRLTRKDEGFTDRLIFYLCLRRAFLIYRVHTLERKHLLASAVAELISCLDTSDLSEYYSVFLSLS